jgi:cyclohexyl-isocyanide hydratase
LAEAGLLDGYRATTHWSHYDDFAHYPAVQMVRNERVVVDRNRMTAGGVTAGIDFALHFVGAVADPDSAAIMQLLLEYDPAPPTNFGHPRSAPPELVARTEALLKPMRGGLDGFLAAKSG